MKQNNISIKQKIGKGYNRYWHDKHFYRVVKGSRGSKKSKNTALNFIYRIMKYEWANLLVVRRYSNTNKQSTYTDLKWATSQFGVSHLFKFNESMPEITYLPTGQKILFRGLDDELKITSIAVDTGVLCWVWFEEAYQIENKEKFQTVVESIRGSYDSPDFFKQITITFNPWSEKHWLKSTFFDDETREKDCFAITTTFRCNEWLDEQDRNRYMDLFRTNPKRARIVCDGDWGVSEGLVFDNYVVEDFDKLQVIKHYDVAHGIDFGFVNDPTTLVSCAVDKQDKVIYIYDEHYEKAMLTQDIYNMIDAKGLNRACITADSAEQRLIKEIRMLGVPNIKGAVKGKNSVLEGIYYLQDFKIVIHPSCEHAIEEFGMYSFQRDKEGNWLNTPEDANNHIIDALRYAVEGMRKQVKVKTFGGGI